MNTQAPFQPSIAMNLDNKTALVCGASQGIGKATAFALAHMGCRVVGLARREGELKSLCENLPPVASGQPHAYIATDLMALADLDAKIQSWVASHGSIQILINNTAGPKAGPLLAAADEEFANALQGHILSAAHLTRALVPGMQSCGYGRVVNIISTSVRIPIANIGVSNTIRAAMAGWAKTLANELAPHGITVNNVLPGYTLTDRLKNLAQASAQSSGKLPSEIEAAWKQVVPLGRFAEPEEVAAAVAFLASPAAGYITGVSLPVDGGRIGAI